jgi:hypothetical protein
LSEYVEKRFEGPVLGWMHITPASKIQRNIYNPNKVKDHRTKTFINSINGMVE